MVLQFLRRHLPKQALNEGERFIGRMSPLDEMAPNYSTCATDTAPAMNVDCFAQPIGICQDPLEPRHLIESRNAKILDRKANIGERDSTNVRLIAQ
jgi:hypothetical protein